MAGVPLSAHASAAEFSSSSGIVVPPIRRLARGFTLQELLITISIAAILVSAGMPSFRTLTANNRRTAEINAFVAVLQYARSEAVTRQRRIGICPTADRNSCTADTEWDIGWLVFEDAASSGTKGSRDNGETILKSFQGPSHLSMQASVTAVLYGTSGRTTTYPDPALNTPGDFVFCDQRGAPEARVVQLAPSGRPRVETTLWNGVAATCP